ncbi:HET-domain-containing protein, partial [Stipitochalara longipes BDJ]
MDSNESTYKYRPLTEPGAIRLIELPPSEDLNARLECALIHTTFNDMNDELVYHYCALSYVWGDDKDTKPVVVDGRGLHITTNLESALRLLRDPRLVRYIWADAICINQNDDEEKAIQVTQMGEVYKAARHTIIWLGEGSGHDGPEHMLASIRNAKRESQIKKAAGRSDIPQIWPGELKNQLLGLERLVDLPWFTRVWIYQELVVSPDPWLQVGPTRARWVDIAMIISSCLQNTDGFSEPCNRFLAMDKARNDFHVQLQKKGRSQVLLDTLLARRGLGVFDARDMIFAHLGIVGESPLDVSPDEWDLLRADYKKDCSQLYRNVAHCFSQWIDIFKLLSHVEAASDQRYPDTPSWTPNW